MSGYQQAKQALGTRLRQLRADAALSSRKLAELIGVSQSKVSKIETGRLTPTAGDVQAWARAAGAPAEVTEELLARLRAVQAEYATWRSQLRGGHERKQREVLDLEARARLLRVFQPALIPGLLQTADYARARLAAGARRLGTPTDTEQAVAARVQRQQVLYDRHKRFQFLLTEAALRYRLCPPEVVPAQLDRLLTVSTLPNVTLGVLPFGTALPAAPLHAFVLFDDELVTVETFTAELRLRDPDEVAAYVEIFEQISSVALFGDDARAVLRQIAVELHRSLQTSWNQEE